MASRSIHLLKNRTSTRRSKLLSTLLSFTTTLLYIALFLTNDFAWALAKLPENLNSIKATSIKPLKSHKKTSALLLKQLYYEHYRDLNIDDQLSSFILDNYLKELDPQKQYFLAADIKEFEKYRYIIDNSIKNSNLTPGFTIFNRYQQHVVKQLVFVIGLIENEALNMEFKEREYLITDREKADWLTSRKELNELWTLKLKNAVLSLKIAQKELPEIKQILSKRYRSQLQRTLQANSEDAFQAYMNAITKAYDPHTQYFSPRTSENFNINMSLSLEGIGAVLQTENEYTKVVRLVPAGPADKSKALKPADRIVGVGQGEDAEVVDVVGWRIDEVVQLIRGPAGSLVRLDIIPSEAENEHETRQIKIIRDKVRLEEQAAKKQLINIKQGEDTYKIGVVDIPTFYIDFKALQNKDPNYRSTTKDVGHLINELSNSHIDGLIVDLRNNGGGSLQEANALLGLFIETGPTVQVKNDRGKIELLKDKDHTMLYKGPMAVLINRLSASASEIFAGAIQDYQRGLVVGTQTFGKGTVQALKPLDRGQLKITQAKFYRISGISNQHQGIIPDIKFPSLYDVNEIGESALENALPWDSIKPIEHKTYFKINPFINKLTQLHLTRVAKDPDFQYLLKNIELNKKMEQDKKISLNEIERKQERKQREQERLNLLNKKRFSKGLKTLEKLPKDDSLTSIGHDDDGTEDILLKEAAHVLSDYIHLSDQRVSLNDSI